jgi:hypothetical protein
MPRIHWVARQNKLETPKEKEKVNKQAVHECDGRARDPFFFLIEGIFVFLESRGTFRQGRGCVLIS